MQAAQTKTIDGLTFQVSQLPAMNSLLMLNRLRRAVGPALGKVVGAAGAKGLAGMDVGKAAEALEALNLPDDELEGITRALLAGTFVTIDGRTSELMPQFDVVMAGRMSSIMKLLAFAMQVNYGDFSNAVRAFQPPPATATEK